MSNWKEFISRQKNEEVYFPCDVIIDGEELKNVAIRSKGNSSRMSIGSSGSEKYSWRFKLDEYDDYVNYHGLTEFCMNNFYSDATCMRDVLCYDALHEVKGVGPDCAYTDMYLNGELFSFYCLIEQPGTTLAERLAIDDNSILYKATERNNNKGGGGGGMAMFGGGDSYCSFTQNMANDNFDVKFGVDDNYQHIEELKQAINKLSNNDYKFIEDLVDVPSFLKGFAENSVMCNYDSYNGSLAHNYYLMDTGGKSGSQASVTIIRALSLGELEFRDAPKVIWKEIKTSVLCGVSLAALCFLKIILFDRMLLGNTDITYNTAFVVCFTMAVTVLMAKMVGCSLPMLAKKIGFDPAVMASPFITTIVDALSLLVYFGIASVFLF